MTARVPPQEVFTFTLKAWLFFFLGVFAPLNFLYHAQALLASFSWLQLGLNVALLILFYTGIALILAAGAFILAFLSSRLAYDLGAIIKKINMILINFLIILVFLGYFWEWLKLVFGVQIPSWLKKGNLHLIIIPLSILFSLVFKLLNSRAENRFHAIITSFFRVFPLLLAFSFLLSGYVMLSGAPKPHELGRAGLPPDGANASAARPNIIIVTFDSLASRYTSLQDPHLGTTPYLEQLARESFVFERMYATSNWTIPSLASLMTGKYPHHHGITQKWSYFWGAARQETLPLLLKGLGYETAAIWSNPYSCPWRNNLHGFDRINPPSPYRQFLFQVGLGPATWLEHMIFPESDLFKRLDALLYNDERETYTAAYGLAQAAALLPKLKPPFFLWIHLFPPHAPYLATNGFLYSRLPDRVFHTKQSYERPLFYPPQDQLAVDLMLKRYQEHLQGVDQEFGLFLDGLKQNGVLDQSLLIVSSDHGEMFSHGFWSHGGPYLYEPLIRVPLLIRLPGQTQGFRLSQTVSTVDLAPTILDLLGLTPPPWMDGQSLWPVLQGQPGAEGIKLTMNLSYVNDILTFKTKSIAALLGNYQLIRYLDLQRDEYYHIHHDAVLKTLTPEEEVTFRVLREYLDRVLSQ